MARCAPVGDKVPSKWVEQDGVEVDAAADVDPDVDIVLAVDADANRVVEDTFWRQFLLAANLTLTKNEDGSTPEGRNNVEIVRGEGKRRRKRENRGCSLYTVLSVHLPRVQVFFHPDSPRPVLVRTTT